VLLVITICIMYIFATDTARTHIFSAFWTTHQLLYALYVIILLHGSVRLVQVTPLRLRPNPITTALAILLITIGVVGKARGTVAPS